MKGEFVFLNRSINSLLSKICNQSKDRILDIGSGSRPSYHPHIKGSVTSFDRFKATPQTIVGDANKKLPFKPGLFDKILCIRAFYYLSNPHDSVQHMARVLKKNGKLVMVLPFMYPLHDAPHDKYRFTKYGIRTVLDSHFKIQRIQPLGGMFTLPAVVVHAFMKGVPLMFPRGIRSLLHLVMYIFYPFYFLAQVIGLLDSIDSSGRFATYYVVIAQKK